MNLFSNNTSHEEQAQAKNGSHEHSPEGGS